MLIRTCHSSLESEISRVKPASPLLAAEVGQLKPPSPLLAGEVGQLKPASPLRARNGLFWCSFWAHWCHWFQCRHVGVRCTRLFLPARPRWGASTKNFGQCAPKSNNRCFMARWASFVAPTDAAPSLPPRRRPPARRPGRRSHHAHGPTPQCGPLK